MHEIKQAAVCLTLTQLVFCSAASCAPVVHLAGKAAAKPSAKTATAAPKTIIKGGASQASIKAYCNSTWSRLCNKWIVPDGNNNVTLTVALTADGSVGDIQADSSPKNDQAEGAAMSALDQAKPLGALPTGMGAGKLTVKFESKADPHGDSSSGGSVRLDPVN